MNCSKCLAGFQKMFAFLLQASPIAVLVVASLGAAISAQDAKPDPPKVADQTKPGCIVVQTESKEGEVAGYMFGLGVGTLFTYLYSNNLNGVNSIEKYQDELAKWKAKRGPKPQPPEFDLATLTVWNWSGLKIIPLAHKHTDAELQSATATCDAFVAATANASQ